MGKIYSKSRRLFAQRLISSVPDISGHPDDQWFDIELVQRNEEVLRREDFASFIPHGLHPDDWLPVLGVSSQEYKEEKSISPTEGAAHISQSAKKDCVFPDIDLLPPEVIVESAALIPDGIPSFDFPIDLPDLGPAVEGTYSKPTMPLSPERRLAIMRASGLVHHLTLPTERYRKDALVRLASVFEEFPHGATAQALAELAKAGASVEEIECLAAVRVAWRNDPSLWLIRRNSLPHGWQTTSGCQPLRNAFTWRLAWRLFRGVAPNSGIDALQGELRDRWLRLRPRDCLSSNEMRPAFYSFPALLETLASAPDLNFDSDLLKSQLEGWPYDTSLDLGARSAMDYVFVASGIPRAPRPHPKKAKKSGARL